MEKNKLAELVLQRMREKKEIEDRNRPHYQVLQMEAAFSYELNGILKTEISTLQHLLIEHNQTLDLLQLHAEVPDKLNRNSTSPANDLFLE